MSKNNLIKKIVESYSSNLEESYQPKQSFGDAAYVTMQKNIPYIDTHYSPEYPDMDDILTARHFNTYMRSDNKRNHPVKGENYAKAGQTANPEYNQDHGYMPGEDEQYYFPRGMNEDSLQEIFGIRKAYRGLKSTASNVKKQFEDDYKKRISDPHKAHLKKKSEELVAKGKKTADQHWEDYRDGTFHSADGHYYDYIRSKQDPRFIHVRQRGSKSNNHEVRKVNPEWSNEHAMRHHYGPSHLEKSYSDPTTAPKVVDESVLIKGAKLTDYLKSAWINKKPTTPNQSLKTPIVDKNTSQLLSNVAKYLGASTKTVTKTVAEGFGMTPRKPPKFGEQPRKPRAPGGDGVHQSGGLVGGRFHPTVEEERYIISYVHKGTLKEGQTKPWNKLHLAEAQALAMMQSGLYDEVQVLKD